MFNRSVSKWYIVLSVLYVVVGAIMIFWPNVTVDLLGIVLGVALLAYGVARIIIYFTKNHLDGIIHMDLTVGVVFGAMGGFMLLHRDFVSTVFPFAVAIMLLIGAISKLQYAIDMKRLGVIRYKLFFACALIVFVLGLVLIANPFKDQAMIWFIGASLIVEGILNCIAILVISSRIRKSGRGSFEVTDHTAPGQAHGGMQPVRRPEEQIPMREE